MKHPPAVLILAMAGGVAKAAVSQFVNHVHHRSHHDHEKPRQQRSLARQLTHQELEPLDHHITSIGSQCLAQGLDPVELARQASRHPQALSDIVSMMSTAAFSVTCKLVVEAAAMLLALTQRQWNILALLILLEALLVADYFWHTAETQATQESRPLPLLPPEPSKAAPHVDERLSGVWYKVDELSDSQEPAANLLRLSGLARTATCLFKGMEFQLEDGHIAMKPLTKLPFLKVSQEVYALDGSVSLYGRRDLRKGKFCGYVKAQPNGGVNLYYKWEEPLAGHCCDEIKLVSPKDLHITTHLTVGTDSCTYRVVYRRASGSGASSKEEEVPLALKAPEPGPLGLGSAGCDMAQSSTTSSSQAATTGSGRGSMSSSDHRTGSGMTEEAYDSCTVGSDVKRGSRGGHQVSPFARVCNM